MTADPGRDERRGERAMGTETVQTTVRPVRSKSHGRVIVDWLTTTDHKKIGHL